MARKSEYTDPRQELIESLKQRKEELTAEMKARISEIDLQLERLEREEVRP